MWEFINNENIPENTLNQTLICFSRDKKVQIYHPFCLTEIIKSMVRFTLLPLNTKLNKSGLFLNREIDGKVSLALSFTIFVRTKIIPAPLITRHSK